ncbi:MAG TPA: DUF4212 domain-containing protein, partial [Roseiflexaceae bacterium]|nr:DUF4212 domain-containing protein [Roseiflexaceae bacterium]
MKSFDWLGLLQLAGLWVLVVYLALQALDLLFPRLRRDDGDAPPTAMPPTVGAPPSAQRAMTGPRQPGQPTATLAPRARQAYWQTNVRMILVMLLIWAGAWFVPATLAPWLNQFQIFTGFPLGYYMGSQGSLVVFLGLITAYAWRAAQLDLRFRSAPWLPGGVRKGRAATRRIGLIYVLFTIGFVLFALLM